MSTFVTHARKSKALESGGRGSDENVVMGERIMNF